MKYSIKNFRVFDSEGVTLDIAPITILTGCNSSGKSSIAKSLLLLDSFLSPIKENIQQGHDVNLNDSKIDFNKRPYSLLGN
jgi:AAA15 family ATPase/GTPase